jgi:tRNA 5-methylaminomethyl-2-thiouridine biosynthesis bifunctional protein
MKSLAQRAGLVPAHIEWADDGTPHAPHFGDIYRPRQAPYAQAQEVFMRGCGLPEAWQGRDDFVVLELGFGLAHNFLALWQAWRTDPARCRRLVVVALEAHLPTAQELLRAHQQPDAPWAAELAHLLAAQWPAPVVGMHTVALEGGALRLLLALGKASDMAPRLRLSADAFFIDGFAPNATPSLWDQRLLSALARRCVPGARAATWSVAHEVREALADAGFEVQRVNTAGNLSKRQVCQARYAPRPGVRQAAGGPRQRPVHALVVGAGLAGACMAQALAQQGVAVTVLEQDSAPAQRASGNPGGIFHAVVHGENGPHARWLRAGATRTAAWLAPELEAGRVAGACKGLMRLEPSTPDEPHTSDTLRRMQALLARLSLPPQSVQALGPLAASARAGTLLEHAAWFYPQAGWVSPADWVPRLLQHPLITVHTGAAVHSIEHDGQRFEARGRSGEPLGRAAVCVLCSPEAPAGVFAAAAATWPLQRSRGQLTWAPCAPSAWSLPVASNAYALPLPGQAVLFGATRDAASTSLEVRQEDHGHNLHRLMALAPTVAQGVDARQVQGRTGLRVHTPDRLPLAGPLPAPVAGHGGQPLHQPRHAARRVDGAFVLTALGSRGLSLAPLLAELVAAQATGAPWPVEQDLADAVDPARFAQRFVQRFVQHFAQRDQRRAAAGARRHNRDQNDKV